MNSFKAITCLFLFLSHIGISQPYYKLEVQIQENDHQLSKGKQLCICKNDQMFWGFEEAPNSNYFFCPLDLSLCDSSYLQFAYYHSIVDSTMTNNLYQEEILFLKDISISNNSYQLGENLITIISIKKITEKKYQKMMKRQFNRFFLNGWFPKRNSIKAPPP